MESVAVSVSAVIALHELTGSRDDKLNEKAYLRAMMKKSSESNRFADSYICTTFTESQEVSTSRMIEERLARERILQMQSEISRNLAQLA